MAFENFFVLILRRETHFQFILTNLEVNFVLRLNEFVNNNSHNSSSKFLDNESLIPSDN